MLIALLGGSSPRSRRLDNAKGCIKRAIVGGVAGRFRRIFATNKQRVSCLVDRNQVRFGGVSPKLALGGRES
jgi:hypothetical protein